MREPAACQTGLFGGEIVADVFGVGGGEGFAGVGEEGGVGGIFEGLEARDDGGGDDLGAGGVGVVVVFIEFVDFLAAHDFVAVGAEVGEVEDGGVEFFADVFGPLGVFAVGGAAFDGVFFGVIIVGKLGQRLAVLVDG